MRKLLTIAALIFTFAMVLCLSGCGEPKKTDYSQYEHYAVGEWLSYEELLKAEGEDDGERRNQTYHVSINADNTWAVSEYAYETDERHEVYSGTWEVEMGYYTKMKPTNTLIGPFVDGILFDGNTSEKIGSFKFYPEGKIIRANGIRVQSLDPFAPEDPYVVVIKQNDGKRLVLHCENYEDAVKAHKDFREWLDQEIQQAEPE